MKILKYNEFVVKKSDRQSDRHFYKNDVMEL